ncbi:hypothetical protein MPTK2_7g10660 [Marchantia polymorpha subsp. ruderalis]
MTGARWRTSFNVLRFLHSLRSFCPNLPSPSPPTRTQLGRASETLGPQFRDSLPLSHSPIISPTVSISLSKCLETNPSVTRMCSIYLARRLLLGTFLKSHPREMRSEQLDRQKDHPSFHVLFGSASTHGRAGASKLPNEKINERLTKHFSPCADFSSTPPPPAAPRPSSSSTLFGVRTLWENLKHPRPRMRHFGVLPHPPYPPPVSGWSSSHGNPPKTKSQWLQIAYLLFIWSMSRYDLMGSSS